MKIKTLLTALFLLTASTVFGAAIQIDFLAGSLQDESGKPLNAGIVVTRNSANSAAKAVWEDKDKTQPSTLGKSQFDLDAEGRAIVFAEGVYTILVYDADDTGLTSPILTFSGVTYGEDDEAATTVIGLESLTDLVGVSSPTDGDKYTVGRYYETPDTIQGGGTFVWDAAASESTANGGTIIDPDNVGTFDGTQPTLASFIAFQGTGGGTGCWVRLDSLVHPSTFGAVCDSTTNDEDALDAAALAGGVLTFEPGKECDVAGLWNIPVSLVVDGYGGELDFSTDAINQGIYVTASDVEIRGLEIEGPDSGDNDTQNGILVIGTSGSEVTGFVAKDNYIHDWGYSAVQLGFVWYFDVSDNHADEIYYSAIQTRSSRYGTVNNNRIEDVLGTGNAYGIQFTKTSDSDPNSADISADNNFIQRVLVWEGIDTHGGERLSITNNTILDCPVGIQVGEVVGSDGPNNTTVTGNVIVGNFSALALADTRHGIQVVGTQLGTANLATANTVSGNSIRDFEVTGVYVRNTDGLTIADNSIFNAGIGIDLIGEAVNTTVVGNAIGGLPTGGIGIQVARAASGAYPQITSGVISGNTIEAKAETGINFVDPIAEVQLVGNSISYTTGDRYTNLNNAIGGIYPFGSIKHELATTSVAATTTTTEVVAFPGVTGNMQCTVSLDRTFPTTPTAHMVIPLCKCDTDTVELYLYNASGGALAQASTTNAFIVVSKPDADGL